MKRVHVLVEGQTEETFVKNILTEHFYQHDVYLTPVIVKTKRTKGGPHYKGGVTTYQHIKRDVNALLGDSSVHRVTTMLDLYMKQSRNS